MSTQAEPGPGVTVIGERPGIDAPELPAKPYEFVMETGVESLDTGSIKINGQPFDLPAQ